jgi:hypothetical protein
MKTPMQELIDSLKREREKQAEQEANAKLENP